MKKVPQIIRDECPLPDTHVWDDAGIPPSHGIYAGIATHEKGTRGRWFGWVRDTFNEVTIPKDTDGIEYVKQTFDNEIDACRFLYAQFLFNRSEE